MTAVIRVRSSSGDTRVQALRLCSGQAIPLHPKHPERVCWGCDKYCPADDLACGNGTIRTAHPAELFGDDWLQWAAGRAPQKI